MKCAADIAIGAAQSKRGRSVTCRSTAAGTPVAKRGPRVPILSARAWSVETSLPFLSTTLAWPGHQHRSWKRSRRPWEPGPGSYAPGRRAWERHRRTRGGSAVPKNADAVPENAGTVPGHARVVPLHQNRRNSHLESMLRRHVHGWPSPPRRMGGNPRRPSAVALRPRTRTNESPDQAFHPREIARSRHRLTWHRSFRGNLASGFPIGSLMPRSIAALIILVAKGRTRSTSLFGG